MRLAIRSLAKAPAFSAAVVLTLAIGLGTNAALFAIVNRILLEPLPYPDATRLVAIGETLDGRAGPASATAFLAWQREGRTVEGVAAYRSWGFVLMGAGEPERLGGARVSAGLFPLLGVTPLLGRAFTPDDDLFGKPRVALVSEALWERRFGSSRDLINRSFVLNGVAHAVIGVLPRGFRLPEADVYVPLALEPFAAAQPGNRALTVVGRLSAGQTPSQASAEMDAIARRATAAAGSGSGGRSPGESGFGAVAVPLTEHLFGSARPTLLVAWGAVALVLLIGCANTASLMLARAASRRQEIAICRALGASRARVAARVLSESLVLALAGGMLGVPLAVALLDVVASLAPPDLPRLDGIGLDVPLLVFTAGLSVATAVLFGLLPAIRSSRAGLSDDLRAGTRGVAGGPAHSTLRHLALSAQVGLAMIVLVGAGLLVRSFARVAAIDPGFNAAHVLAMTVSLPDAKYGDPLRRRQFFDAMMQRARAMPGVQSVGVVSHTPLAGAPLTADVSVEGAPDTPSGEMSLANCGVVGGDWFAAMRIPIVRGRGFSDRDAAGAPLAIVINARMAARLWPNADPIGRRVVVGGSLGADRSPREVVGIVGDVRSTLEAAPPDQVYIPYAQSPWPTMSVMARTAGDPAALAGPLRAAVQALDPDQAVHNLRPLDAVIARAVAARRFQVFVLSVFAAVALVLAGTGVYSVVSYGVRQRRQEVGVRLALGARKADVMRLAVGDSLRWAAAGLAAGSLAAGFAARGLAGVLYEIPPTDVVTFAAAAVASTLIVLLASASAGSAALRIDPAVALKGESRI